jgi:hypothetical protein
MLHEILLLTTQQSKTGIMNYNDNNQLQELESENRRLQDDVVHSLVQSNTLLSRELEVLKNRLGALETAAASASAAGGGGSGGGEGITAAGVIGSGGAANNYNNKTKSIKWAEEKELIAAKQLQQQQQQDDSSDRAIDGHSSKAVVATGDNNDPPPMRRIKFLDHHVNIDNPDLMPAVAQSDNSNIANNNQQQDDDAASFDNTSTSSSSSSSSEAIAFSGWARVFFQARHHRSATQITSSASTSPSQDTYLHLSISSTSNVLRISDTDDTTNTSNNNNNMKKPPLIDPPIPLKFFHAVKVPGSNSGAALFLKNDTRRLRKYIFRFEFMNSGASHQPPQRYVQFVRSGNAAKKSMRSINKMKRAFKSVGSAAGGGGSGGNSSSNGGGNNSGGGVGGVSGRGMVGMSGEERKENLKEDKKKATDAFAAHLGTLDELLREGNDMADRFVDCVNSRNEEEEAIIMASTVGGGGNIISGGGGLVNAGANGSATGMKRSRPPPPFWGSGYNRPSTNDQDDDIESDSDFSDDEEELYYDDDNDDETLFDKVQVSTEQTLETLWNHIVK